MQESSCRYIVIHIMNNQVVMSHQFALFPTKHHLNRTLTIFGQAVAA